MEAFKTAFISLEGQRLLKERVTLLHCTTEYPAPVQDVNLLAMNTMRNAFWVAGWILRSYRRNCSTHRRCYIRCGYN
ncbi:N-acetylneuraminate synthase family protein [Paenibacillus rhizoplanae]